MNPHILSHEQVLDCLRVKHEQLTNGIWRLASDLLDDENGISDRAYQSLIALCNKIHPGFASQIHKQSDCTDSRWYISKPLQETGK